MRLLKRYRPNQRANLAPIDEESGGHLSPRNTVALATHGGAASGRYTKGAVGSEGNGGSGGGGGSDADGSGSGHGVGHEAELRHGRERGDAREASHEHGHNNAHGRARCCGCIAKCTIVVVALLTVFMVASSWTYAVAEREDTAQGIAVSEYQLVS